MKYSELQQKNPDELKAMLTEKRHRVDQLRFLLQQKKVKNVHELSVVRKDIAKILTLLHAK